MVRVKESNLSAVWLKVAVCRSRSWIKLSVQLSHPKGSGLSEV